MQKGGSNTPIEGLRQMPIFLGTSATENDSNGGDGTAFISLYGLGSNNVLTLINGRRAFSFSDINAIPISALARAEILKHNGGAIYGSGAVAGVFNFILINGPGERPYEGAELHAFYGNTSDADAHVRQVYLRGGVTGLDGKVSIAAAGEYYSRANLFSRDREISKTGDASNDANGQGWGGPNNNSPTFGGRVSVVASASTFYPVSGSLVLTNLLNNQVTPGSYRRFEQAPGSSGTDPARFNFRAFTPAIPAMEKAMYFVTGRYKIFGDGLQLYGDVMYSKVKQDNGQAGSSFSLTSVANGITEARNSPFNPFGNDLNLVSYRLQQELGNRRSFFDKDYWRYVAGINGDFNFRDNDFISRFGYDSGFVYERLDVQRVDSGDATRTLIRQAIAGTLVPGVFFNPFIGINAPLVGNAPTYTIVGNHGIPTGLTAPYDNRTTAMAASYIGHSFFHERDWLGDLKLNAHVFPNLWNGGIDLAAGYGRRTINQKQIPDPVEASGNQLGFNELSLFKYRQEVDSWFTELYFPLVTSKMNIFLVRSLELRFAWGREDFSVTNVLPLPTSPVQTSASFANENPAEDFGGSPSISLRYQPFSDLTLRVSWDQSIRPPTFEELFTSVELTFPRCFGIVCNDIQPPGGSWIGGNPAVQPETTDSYSVGVVWTPKFVPGLAVTVDAYQMFTTNVILDPVSFGQLLVTNRVLDPDGCGLGVNPGSGPGMGITVIDPTDPLSLIECVDSGFGNAGKRLVQGLDVTASYELPTERFGKFTFSGSYNHFFTWKAQAGVGPSLSFLGNYDSHTLPFAPGAIPWNKAFLRGEWEWRHFDFVATGNYIGDFRDDQAFNAAPNIIIGSPSYIGRVRTVPSYITLDMQLSYEFAKPEAAPSTYSKEAKNSKNVIQTVAETSSIWQRLLWGATLTVGVNNAFDRNPPSVLAATNDNYDTSLYSIRNRFWYVAISKKF